MKKHLLLALLVGAVSSLFAQNSTENLLAQDSKLVIGGYGEVHYNQPFGNDFRSNGTLDVHRMVMLFGYNFSDKTQFVTELEFEHVKEVYVEQAFLQHKLNNAINLRAGLMLVPMGITNEYHEPTTFNGVERPVIDGVIAPTTWREVGVGISGNISSASLKYQAYIMNGFNGYDDGTAKFSGKKGFRSGRQKGAESYISSPNFAGRVEYYGVKGLKLGLSGYFGKSQSTEYDGIANDDDKALKIADSTAVGIAMLGLDARYKSGPLQLRGQFYYTGISNTEQYNAKTGGDLGNAMMGYYVEAGYDVLKSFETEKQLIPFVRYSAYNTHYGVNSNMEAKPAYENTVITTGLTFALTKGAVIKADVQLQKNEASDETLKVFSAGVGVMF